MHILKFDHLEDETSRTRILFHVSSFIFARLSFSIPLPLELTNFLILINKLLQIKEYSFYMFFLFFRKKLSLLVCTCSCTSRIVCPKLQYFLNFKYNPDKIINLLLFNHFYSVISCRRVQKKTKSDELLCTVLVTRYGPQSIANASS